VLELLTATLPELRRGLSESAARTLVYQLSEKLGFGAGTARLRLVLEDAEGTELDVARRQAARIRSALKLG
jgi:hypothetical protein